MSNTVYCNNCNKEGHMVYNCRYPMISNGIISFRIKDDKKEYLLVRRKHSHGFMDFVRGKYAVNNKIHILGLLEEMTMDEKKILKEKPFHLIWNFLWGNDNMNFASEKQHAQDKFISLINGIRINNDLYNLDNLLSMCKSNWKEPEWGFPKGKKEFKENDKICAIREWSEETGLNGNYLEFIENLNPYEEIFMGSNYQTYKTKYFIAKYKYIDSKINYDRREIGDAKWCDIDKCLELIRNYNLEKIKIIKKINYILTEYNI
jgi:ADP-ribose pyrophosphatase YjhB (NUDIX family)